MQFGRYRFVFELPAGGKLPPFKGSALRGAFGHALKKAVCTIRQRECSACLLHSTCLYARIFETRHYTPGSGARTAAPPHPFVLQPPTTLETHFEPGDHFDCHLLLFGAFNDYLPYFVLAFEEMAKMGLGRWQNGGRSPLKLAQVEACGQIVYTGAERQLREGEWTENLNLTLDQARGNHSKIVLHLLTPLRVKSENRLQADLPFSLLVRTMMRRIGALFETFGEGPPELDFRGLIARADEVEKVDSDLKWEEIRRYSSRQKEAMFVGGIRGSVSYRGRLGEFMPLLEISRKVHLGKQTTFGLGRIDFE